MARAAEPLRGLARSPRHGWGRRQWYRGRCEERGAVRIHISQSRHTVVLPASQGGGWHGESSVAKKQPARIIRDNRLTVHLGRSYRFNKDEISSESR